jgi:hypothetical protein
MERLVIFLYSLLWLILLLAVGAIYLVRPEMIMPLFKAEWQKDVLHSIWFAMLGAVAISLKGVYDHFRSDEWPNWEWSLWYLGRPLSGGLVGIMTYVLLQVANPGSAPSIPALAVAAFTLGTQEKRFFSFLAAVATLVLTTPADQAAGLTLKAVTPTTGSAGTTLVVQGSGFTQGTKVTIGSGDLQNLQVGKDGTAAAGTIPDGSGTVDVFASNPNGDAKVLRQGFTYV